MKEVFHPGKRGNKQKVKSENPNVDEFGRILHARHWPPPAWPGQTIILRWQWVRLAKYDDDDVDGSGYDDEYVDGNQRKVAMSMLMCWQHMKDTATSEQAYELTKMTMPRMKMITWMVEIMMLVMMMTMMTKVMVVEILHGLPAGCLASQV